MKSKLINFFKKLIAYSFYLFVFLLPWQTKLILRSDATNFQEISLYLSSAFLIFSLFLLFFYKIKWFKDETKVSGLWLALTSFEIFIIISFFFSTDQILSFYHYILILLGIGLFYLLREANDKYQYEEAILNKTKIVYLFFISVFLQACLGIYQFLTQSTFAFKYLGLAEHNPNALGTAVVECSSGRWLRSYGGFDHPNIFGGVLAITLLVSIYLLARKKVIRSKAEMSSSLFLFIFYFVGLLALFFTFSRAAYLAFFIGLICLLIINIRQKDYWILGRFLALLFFSIVMAGLIAFPYSDLLVARSGSDTRLERKSRDERIEYSYQAKEVISQHWASGVGIGNYVNFIEIKDQFRKDIWDYQPVHNFFLLLWAEAGVGALFSILIFFFYLKKDCQTNIFWAVFMAVITLMFFDHWLLSLPFGVIFLFFVFGLI